MADNSKYGSFVPTTNIYDLEQLTKKNLKPEDIQTLLVRLRQTINSLAIASNIKDTGYYVQEEFVNGQLWFEDPSLNSQSEKTPALRQVYRKVINFGALPNATTKSVAHGLDIQDTWTFTRIYATASDTASKEYISIPYSAITTVGSTGTGVGTGTGSGTGTGTGTLDLSTIRWSDTSVPISTSVSTSVNTTVNTTVTISTSPTSEFIDINADATNVNITAGSDRTAFSTCYVVLEYIKE